jgi:hypothetical protein
MFARQHTNRQPTLEHQRVPRPSFITLGEVFHFLLGFLAVCLAALALGLVLWYFADRIQQPIEEPIEQSLKMGKYKYIGEVGGGWVE